ncbi:MAG: hypothetical protein M1827_006001 [Pycnora praestabilis]|nr:MAG: hypothetical protein M1827_006001 [Pycnora praestabilis]
MGIPHLITHLRAYSEPTRAGVMKVIIDGPSLCYHIYHACLASRANYQNPLQAAPSYEELGKAFIAWLDLDNGLKKNRDKIYFDGFLPLSKYDVRNSRLQSSQNQLKTCHSLHIKGLSSMLFDHTAIDCSPSGLFNLPHVPSRLTALPAPPFLVPAILETLLASPVYGSKSPQRVAASEDGGEHPIVEVVPGEADFYCAKRAREVGGEVWTSDSDLLVYDLGSEGSVIFLKDIELTGSGREGHLRALRYSPSNIANRLELKDTSSLAFEMKQDPHAAWHEVLRRAKARSLSSKSDLEYDRFLQEYTSTSAQTSIYNRTTLRAKEPDIQGLLRELDPRISEFIHQHGIRNGCAEQPASLFLPFLIDDPNRSAAWNVGAFWRRLGCEIFKAVLPREYMRENTIEYLRRGTRITGVTVPSLTMKQAESAMETFLYSWRRVKEMFETSNVETWRIFGLCELCHWLVDDDKTLPSRTELKQLLTSRHPLPIMSWDFIHLSAQWQAMLYSFRILAQLTAATSIIDRRHGQVLAFSDTVASLQEELQSLPTLHELLPTTRVKKQHQEDEKAVDDVISILYALLEIEEPLVSAPETPAQQGEPRKKRRRRRITKPEAGRVTAGAPRVGRGRQSNNMYDLLEES